jgi:hypothetical protein
MLQLSGMTQLQYLGLSIFFVHSDLKKWTLHFEALDPKGYERKNIHLGTLQT